MSHLESPIVPSIGRIVLVRGSSVLKGDGFREVPAIVTRVWNQNLINVRVFADDQGDRFITSLEFNDNIEADTPQAWRWMDYQVQTAAKSQDVLGHHGAVIGSPVEESILLSRVKAERFDLGMKWNSLSAFLGSSGYRALSHDHQLLLTEQQEVMVRYSQILVKRIALLERED